MKITAPELHALILEGQGPHLEFASECPDDDALAHTLCAFANTSGGWLLVGVQPDGSVIGCPDPKDVMTRIRLVAEEDIRSPLSPASNSVRTERGILVAVHVQKSEERPHSILVTKSKREIIVRVGLENHVAKGATLKALRSHATQGHPKDALEAKILEWLRYRVQSSKEPVGDASPEEFSAAANVSARRASKAFISLERSGLVIGRGDRYHRMYALP